jgi:site-specific DNA-methyltransferase (adenine-specific)
MEKNKIYLEDNLVTLSKTPNNYYDMVITSPPYDGIRKYNGFAFDIDTLTTELYRTMKNGGVIVWVVNDQVVKGSETGTSFRQALKFMDAGFLLHDTMIYEKDFLSKPDKNRYHQSFEYMFVLSKGQPKTFNPIKDRKNKHFGRTKHGTFRLEDGTTKPLSSIGKPIAEYGQRFNIWDVSAEKSNLNRLHPAMFPESLAHDHIVSWSNEGDTVFDCFLGSGTTGKVAKQLNRRFVGIEISPEYLEIAKKRIYG